MRHSIAWGWIVLAVGCGGENMTAAPLPSRQGSLDLEIRDRADVRMAGVGSVRQVDLRVSKGFGIMPRETRMAAQGRVDEFPEAGKTMYTARFSVDPEPNGPCGSSPVSLALSLLRDGSNARVAGSLTAYCGRDTWHGVPARVLRLSGDFPF